MKAGAIVSGGFFVPARLVGRLSEMAGAPAAFVEAPSGFGKTTAVREFLRARGARALWHTCLGEPAARSWGALCRMLSEFAPEAAASLAALVLPTRENLADATAIVRGIAPEHEVFIVVDNYQLFSSELRREIMEVFSMHGGGLHMVFISQPLDFSSDVLGWGHILRVTAKDFLFDRESTAELWVSDTRVCAVLTSAAGEKHLLTDGQTLYVWYASDEKVRQLPVAADVTMDELTGIPTYELLDTLPPETITDGEFITDDRYDSGRQIFAAAEQDGVRRECWISLDYGLLTESILKREGETVYDALQTGLEILAAGDEAFDDVFVLPDGTSPFQ